MDQLARDIIKTALFNAPVTTGVVTLDTLEQFSEHTIQFLVADAIMKYEMEPGIREKVEQNIALQMRKMPGYLREQTKVTEALVKNNIIPVILKGTAASMYYPEPGLRAMGDIDFLLYPNSIESFEVASKALCECGFNEYQEREERLQKFVKGKLEIEMHRYFTSMHTQRESKIDEIISASTPVERKLVWYDTYRFYSMPDEINGLILLEHISRHLYSGLGFRQIIDWIMYVNAVVNDDFWEHKLQPLLDEIGLRKFAKNVTRMGEIYFGLQEHYWCAEVDSSNCEKLFSLIDEYGNFGKNIDEVDRLTKSVLNKGLSFSTLQKRGLSHWPAAQRHVILRPFAWIYQIFRYIRRGLKRNERTVGVVENYKDHLRQKQLFETLGIPNNK